MVTNRKYVAYEILSFNQTERIMGSSAKELGKNFYHYTTVDSVNKILTCDENGNCFFFIRNIEQMNDLNEAELHKSESNKIHSFCTCCTSHEKIPLWYLYSGICGNGARLGFTPGKMIKFLKSIKVVYPVVDNKVDYSNQLKINADFELSCGWIYYLMDGNNRVLYRNKFYEIEEIEKETMEKNYFIKDYPWEYEREFRILIKNKTDLLYERLAIHIPPEIISSLEVMSAPERKFTEKEREKYISLGIKPEKIKESRLGVRMNLLENNKKDIMEEIEKWCDEEQCLYFCNYVQLKKKCKEEKYEKN